MQNVMQALYLTRNARGLPASVRRYSPLVSENLTEISDLVTQYVLQHREITVDKTKWLQFCSD